METNFTFMNILWMIILSAAIVAGCILMLVLIKRDKNELASKYLLLTTTGLVIWFLAVKVLLLSGVYLSIPHIIGTAHPFWYIFGPLLYFSVKKYLNPDYRFSMRDSVYLYPLIFYLVVANSFYFLSGSQKISAYLAGLDQSPKINITSVFLYSLIITYTLFCLKLISGTKNRNPDISDDQKLILISWKNLLKGTAAICTLLALVSFVLEFKGFDLSIVQNTTYLGFALLFYFISIIILRNPLELDEASVHSDNTENDIDSTLSKNILCEKPKYRKSSFEKKNAEQYLVKLKNLMASEKPFLKSDLTLPQLARMINLSTHHLSQLLNQEVNMSFIEFINYYRIKEAQKLLVSPEYSNQTILAVSLEVGFNSKTSFNKMFKKYTGITPSEFIRKNSRRLHKAAREYATQ